MMLRFLLIGSTIAVILGRFTVPGHALTGWPGLFEALAHMWVGAMLTFALLCWRSGARSSALSALWLLFLATAVETIMALHSMGVI